MVYKIPNLALKINRLTINYSNSDKSILQIIKKLSR